MEFDKLSLNGMNAALGGLKLKESNPDSDTQLLLSLISFLVYDRK